MPNLASKIYRWLIMNGPKYGWYNPARLADGHGTMDEIWHFEYWGPVPAPGTVLPPEAMATAPPSRRRKKKKKKKDKG